MEENRTKEGNVIRIAKVNKKLTVLTNKLMNALLCI